MLKWAGVMLTMEQIGILASNITGNEDFRDVTIQKNIFPAMFAVRRTLTRKFPNVVMWPTSIPRFSNESEHYRALLAVWTYNNPDETMNNFFKEPPSERDNIFFKWLVQYGMVLEDMVNQWTTLPDPLADERPGKVLLVEQGHRRRPRPASPNEGHKEQPHLDTLTDEGHDEPSKD